VGGDARRVPAPAQPYATPEPAIALPWPAPARPVAIGGALDRIRRRQAGPTARLRRTWRRVPSRRVIPFGAPLALLAIVALLIGPTLYQGAHAYQQVFVDRVPHRAYALLPAAGDGATPPPATTGGGSTPASAGASAVEGGGTPTAPPASGPSIATPAAAAVSSLADLPTWDGTRPLTLLLLGIDRREDEPARTDTMILLRVDPVAKRAALLTIPRDLKVIVPGYGVHKVNAAFAIGEAEGVPGGGAALAIQTIEANFGIPIDHFAQVDFRGFVELVDLLGGVTVDVPYAIVDDAYPTTDYGYTHVSFPAGRQRLDGERALQYVRTRHADGDVRRAARQQQVLLALREQASVLDLLPRAGEILATLGDSVRTDLSPEQAIALVRLATEIPRQAITQYTLMDAVGIEEPDGVYYFVADWDEVGRVLSAFTETTVVPPAAALARVDYAVPIRVENGTLNDGLAVRVGEALIANGFTNVTYVPAADPGAHPTTTIVDRSGSVTTAALAAAIVGVDPAGIDERYAGPAPTPSPAGNPSLSPAASPSSAPAETAAAPEAEPPAMQVPDAEQAGIVIVLGDDAPDPAWYVQPPS
jgi:LCP family protein required for cell wall assembly